MKAKVSVIIPTYMEEKYIEDTLKSIKRQTLKPREIIVCDSNSPDKTAKIARKYADKVIVIKKRGVSIGRNRGAKEATGNIFLFLDADTALAPNFIESIEKAFSKKNNLAVACGYVKSYGRKRDRAVFLGLSEIVWLLGKLNEPAFYGICMSIKKDIFERLGGFDESLLTSEDWDLAARASNYGKCEVIRNAIAYTSPRRFSEGNFFHPLIFHITNFFRYKIFGTGSKKYPPIR